MNKVDQVLRNYVDTTGLLFEQPPMDPMAAPPPAAPPMDPMAAPPPAAPAIPPPEGEPSPEDDEDKEHDLTKPGYVLAVRDMVELLSINPEILDDSELGIFEDKPSPDNAYDMHDKLRGIISSHGSPTG